MGSDAAAAASSFQPVNQVPYPPTQSCHNYTPSVLIQQRPSNSVVLKAPFKYALCRPEHQAWPPGGHRGSWQADRRPRKGLGEVPAPGPLLASPGSPGMRCNGQCWARSACSSIANVTAISVQVIRSIQVKPLFHEVADHIIARSPSLQLLH